MLFELEEYEDDLDYRSIPLSIKTPCSEALALIVKKFHLPGEVSDYYLVEVSEENEGKASLALSIGIFSPLNPPLPCLTPEVTPWNAWWRCAAPFSKSCLELKPKDVRHFPQPVSGLGSVSQNSQTGNFRAREVIFQICFLFIGGSFPCKIAQCVSESKTVFKILRFQNYIKKKILFSVNGHRGWNVSGVLRNARLAFKTHI